MLPKYIQEYLKDKSLSMNQKLSAIAMFMDPKYYPQKDIDQTNQLLLGNEIKQLLINNKIKYNGFDESQSILIKKLI